MPRILKFKGTLISKEEENALYVAILLHDIGHGPFSHAIEHSLLEGVNHEFISLRFMEILNDEFIIDNYDYEKTLIIHISASYFIYDCLFMFINKFSMMFFLHHILILSVYYITISNDYGAKLVMYTLFWGEITNPLQISWFLSRYLNYKKIEHYIFPVFSFNFILVRSIIMPYAHFILIKKMPSTKYSLVLLSIIGNIGGLIWVKNIIKKCL